MTSVVDGLYTILTARDPGTVAQGFVRVLLPVVATVAVVSILRGR